MAAARSLLVFSLAALLTSSAAFADQQHLVSPTQLAATVADGAAKQDMNRATVREALERPEVQSVASKLGLDVTRANEAVDALSGAELEKAASAAQQVNEQLVGGASSITLTTTTIIIILLLVILLIVAIK
jgi:preprotein translocase subunit SecF